MSARRDDGAAPKTRPSAWYDAFGDRSLRVIPKLHIVAVDLHRGHVGQRFRAKVGVTGGQEPVWEVSSGKLPAGLKLNPTTGVITGVPRRAGAFGFTVSVSDSLGAKVSIRYTLVIQK